MKFTLENVGPIKKSEMEFGDLTILCGKNNTGKTYITYNTFNYIDAIKYFLHVPVEKKHAEELLASGKILLDLEPFFQRANEYIELSMKKWMPYVASQMAAHENYYKNIKMKLDLGKEHLNTMLLSSQFSGPVQVTKDCFLKISKQKKILTVILQNNSSKLPDIDVVVGQLEWMLKIMIQHLVPDLFIITCERTGAAAFMPTFIASREIAAKQDNDTKLMEDVYRKMDFRGYPRPMNKDLEFVVRFPEAIQEKSFIADKHSEILTYFSEIVGGEYILEEPNIVKFVPKNSNVGLTKYIVINN